ncbi:MAG: hypothetical protein JW939_00300, partial [Candidatus Thermoplasmatota archaeon]|nr:hypothetical protein [Candidatus Thermoplasmatota archaeon]
MFISSMPPPAACQGTTRITFTEGADETLIDEDGDLLYEYLSIGVEVNVYEPGSYGLRGAIGGDQVVANFGPEPLDIGSHTIEIRFSGGGLTQYGASGHYRVRLEIYSTDPGMDLIVRTITTTDEYEPIMFEAPTGSSQVTVESKGDQVFIKGRPMTIAINKTYPELSFYYTRDGGVRSRSSITYERILAFNDRNGDGVWDGSVDDPRYEGDLSIVDWKLEWDVTSGYDIALYGVVQLRLVGTPTVAAWAKLTFRLGSDQLIEEGAAQKFDIDLDLFQPLDADRIALMHILKDEAGSQKLEDAGGGSGRRADSHAINVIGDNGETWGSYSWSDEIYTGSLQADIEAQATSWFDIEDGSASIWFSYPLGDETKLIHHDPTVGMDPENEIGPVEERNILEDRPLIMAGGLMIGILVVAVTIFIRGRVSRNRGGDI